MGSFLDASHLTPMDFVLKVQVTIFLINLKLFILYLLYFFKEIFKHPLVWLGR